MTMIESNERTQIPEPDVVVFSVGYDSRGYVDSRETFDFVDVGKSVFRKATGIQIELVLSLIVTRLKEIGARD